MTLTLKVQWRTINCPCFENWWPNCNERKTGRFSCLVFFHIWPWQLILSVTLAMNVQGHIFKLPFPWSIWPRYKGIKRGWILCIAQYFVKQYLTNFFFLSGECLPRVTLRTVCVCAWLGAGSPVNLQTYPDKIASKPIVVFLSSI